MATPCAFPYTVLPACCKQQFGYFFSFFAPLPPGPCLPRRRQGAKGFANQFLRVLCVFAGTGGSGSDRISTRIPKLNIADSRQGQRAALSPPARSGRNKPCKILRAAMFVPSPDAALGDGDGAARHPYQLRISGSICLASESSSTCRAIKGISRKDAKAQRIFPKKYSGLCVPAFLRETARRIWNPGQ